MSITTPRSRRPVPASVISRHLTATPPLCADTAPMGAVARMTTVSKLVSNASSLVAGNGRQAFVSWAQAGAVINAPLMRTANIAINLSIVFPLPFDAPNRPILQRLAPAGSLGDILPGPASGQTWLVTFRHAP